MIDQAPEARAGLHEGQSAKQIIQNETRFLGNMEKQRSIRQRQAAKSSGGLR